MNPIIHKSRTMYYIWVNCVQYNGTTTSLPCGTVVNFVWPLCNISSTEESLFYGLVQLIKHIFKSVRGLQIGDTYDSK